MCTLKNQPSFFFPSQDVQLLPYVVPAVTFMNALSYIFYFSIILKSCTQCRCSGFL